jgi:hypothetical protein
VRRKARAVRSRPRCVVQLWDRGFHRGECGDLLAGATDGGDAEDRNEAGEPRVFDQVLALLIAHEWNDEVLLKQLSQLMCK